jgi:zinc protease
MTTVTPAPGLEPTRQELDNGAVVVAKASRTTPAVTIHASFEAGTVFEPSEHVGLAYFVSRTIDRGTTTRTADQIAEELDSRGVSLSISVNRHVMSLVCTCLAEDVDAMLGLVGDVAMHPTFPDKEVATRRAEIITTIRQDEDNPAAVAMEGLMELLYPGHPYGRRPRGTVETVDRTTASALQAFHRERFSPTTLRLAVVGDIEPSRAISASARVFGGWRVPAPPPVALPSVEPLARRHQRVVPMMNKAQADIAYGFVAITRSDPTYYACWLMNTILGQYSIGGRLGDSIRERQGMAYYVFSTLDANIVRGPFIVRAGVNPANVERALASIDEEIVKMAGTGPTDREMTETRQFLIGSMPRQLETNSGIANFLQTVEFFNLGLDYDVRLPVILQQISRDQVQAAARRSLDPSKAAVVIAGPYDPARASSDHRP